MKYKRFEIEQYKGIKSSFISVIQAPVPIIGINESGKSSILEAIAHYDYRNDATADAKQWKFINRYNPQENEFVVSADIELLDGEFKTLMEKFTADEQLLFAPIIPSGNEIRISRVFKKHAESSPRIYRINGNESEFVEKVAKMMIDALPRIYYFDNFLEKPFANSVSMPADYITNPATNLDQEQEVIEKMFEDAGYPLREFLSYTDSNDQSTTLSEVNKFVNKQLIEDWQKMNVGELDIDVSSMKNMQIELQLSNTQANTVTQKIKESFKSKGQPPFVATMDLSDRSLGFRWFYNFSIKKCFGTKTNNQVIYLFDEPGSFLHNSAQTVLLDAIIELAKTQPVIFSTHSEFLLDPEKININNIRIVEKDKREIHLVPYAEAKVDKNQGTLSPLYNALRIKIPINSTLRQKVIITEGITDFYFWRMLSDEFVILPGTSAHNNSFLIGLAIGTSEKYIALFDGDDAGDTAIALYTKHYNEEEATNHWSQYKNRSGLKITLEQILSSADKVRLLSLTQVADAKKAMTILFYSDKKDEFWSVIDSETKANISVNLDMIKKFLGLPSSFHTKYSLATLTAATSPSISPSKTTAVVKQKTYRK